MDMNIRARIFFAVLSGLMATCAFPKIGWHWISWVMLVPMFLSVVNIRLFTAFRLGFLSGFVHFATLLYWVDHTMQTYGGLPPYLSVPALFLLASYLSCFVGFFCLLVNRYWKNSLVMLVIVPSFWVCVEYLRSFLFTGFPWELLGYSQYLNFRIIQISDVTGVYGVSFLIVLVNIALYAACIRFQANRAYKKAYHLSPAGLPLLIAAGLFICVWSYGYFQFRTTNEMILKAPEIRVAVVQGNIDQQAKWDPAFKLETINRYGRLSMLARKQKAELLVWPETALPFYFPDSHKYSELALAWIRKIGTHVIFGAPSYRQNNDHIDYYNSAYLVSPKGRILGKYNKVHLVPFGEYVPLKKWFPFLGKMVVHIGDFSSGNNEHPILLDGFRIGMLICYEIIFPELSAASTQQGSAFLVNLTNDAWYGWTSAPYQHFSMSVLRAVENKRAVIRSANTGISGFIYPTGKVHATTGLFKQACLTASIPLLNQKTVYSRIGDFFSYTCIVTGLIFIILTEYKRRTT